MASTQTLEGPSKTLFLAYYKTLKILVVMKEEKN